MVSAFLREQKRYAQKELCQILQCSEEKIVPLIRNNRYRYYLRGSHDKGI